MLESAKPNFRQYKNIVGVIGSGIQGAPLLTKGLGKLIAELGCHLLTGGGEGVMEEVSKDFFEFNNRKGLVIGIIRAEAPMDRSLSSKRRAYQPAKKPNRWVEIPILTHLHLSSKDLASRNHINILSSKVIVALPGGPGTRSEVELAFEYRVPVILYLGDGTIDGKTAGHFISDDNSGRTKIANDLTAIEGFLKQFLT